MTHTPLIPFTPDDAPRCYCCTGRIIDGETCETCGRDAGERAGAEASDNALRAVGFKVEPAHLRMWRAAADDMADGKLGDYQ